MQLLIVKNSLATLALIKAAKELAEDFDSDPDIFIDVCTEILVRNLIVANKAHDAEQRKKS